MEMPKLARLDPWLPPLGAMVTALAIFSLFLLAAGANPRLVLFDIYQGAFGTASSWQDTLLRASPLILTGLCTALPAHVGLTIIGGEGAVVLGGLFCAGVAHLLGGVSPFLALPAILLAGAAGGGLWIFLCGALRIFRGVNEVISSLLLAYIAIALFHHLVEGPMHDPASLNNPSTWPIGDALAMPTLGRMAGACFPHLEPGINAMAPGSFFASLARFLFEALADVHLGLLLGVAAAIAAWWLIYRTTFGFSARVIGGNLRAARLAGLGVGKITLICSFLAGSAAGLAGALEVTAVHGKANGSLIAGYGYTGILVAFMARHHPLVVLPVALLLGGLSASNGLVQRRNHLPDATMLVLQGILFVTIMAFESYHGRWSLAKIGQFLTRTKEVARVG